MKLGLYINLKDIQELERCSKSTAQKRINEARKKLQIPVHGKCSLKNQRLKTADYFRAMGIKKEDLFFSPIF